MKTPLVFLFFLCTLSFVAAQNQIQYEIIQNEPQSLNNLLLYVSPAALIISNNVGVCHGLGGSYNHKDKFMVDLDLRRSYIQKISRFLNDFNDYKTRSQYCEPLTSNKHRVLIELKGHYLLGSYMKDGKVKINIYDSGVKTYYTKVPAKRFYSFPVRLGYAYYQSVMSTGKRFISNEPPFYGKDIHTSAAISGFANHRAHLLNLGLGVYVRDDLKIAINDSQPQFVGIRSLKKTTYYYADIIIPLKLEIENINFVERSHNAQNKLVINETEYNVNDYTAKIKYGFSVGVRSVFMGSKSLCGAIWTEIGCRPGPIDLITNVYFNTGIDLGISKGSIKFLHGLIYDHPKSILNVL